MGSSKSEPRLCGAATRSGGTCRASAMRNAVNGRCRLHGGKSSVDKKPKAANGTPRRGTTKVGGPEPESLRKPNSALYIGAVLPSEASLYAALPVGTVAVAVVTGVLVQFLDMNLVTASGLSVALVTFADGAWEFLRKYEVTEKGE